jgi:hypothetical protein
MVNGTSSIIQEDFMKSRMFLFLGAFAVLIAGLTVPAEAQTQIMQPIVINGQTVNGAFVSAPEGGMQSFTCDNPQPYSTPDGGSQGWACYDGSTGMWLLNALAPQTAQPTVVYQSAPAPVVVYRQSPVVVYRAPARPVVVAPAYPPSVVLGAAAINATSRIIAAEISRPSVIVREPVVVRPRVEVRPPVRGYAYHPEHPEHRDHPEHGDHAEHGRAFHG